MTVSGFSSHSRESFWIFSSGYPAYTPATRSKILVRSSFCEVLISSEAITDFPVAEAKSMLTADRRSPAALSAMALRASLPQVICSAEQISRIRFSSVDVVIARNGIGSHSFRMESETPYASFAMSITGCRASLSISVIARAPPRSAFPSRLSASSRIMSFLSAPKRLVVVAEFPATRSMMVLVRASLALSSRTSQFMSRARAWAADVFPIPGFPVRSSGRESTVQFRAQSVICLTAALLPRMSARCSGRYRSAQSMITN